MTSTPADTLTISRRFNGPPNSANGGYVAGLLGPLVGDCATVRLTAPPPLERPLGLRPTDDGYALLDDGRAVARARPGRMTLEPPPAPTIEQARAAMRHYRGQTEDTFRGCFVCGMDRHPGDGLRVFAGPLEDGQAVAAAWTPEASVADKQGNVKAEFVWAALDCPGAFALGQGEVEVLLLGEMTTELRDTVPATEPYVVVGWREGEEGRKQYSGTALFDASGACLAIARGTWFAVPRERIA